MATAKDFNQTAANIKHVVEETKASWDGVARDAALDTAKAIAEQMASAYSRENAKFDRARFLTACGF